MATKRRGINPIVYFVLGILAFAMVTIGFSVFSVDTTVRSGDFISVPTYGYLKCEQSDNKVVVPASGFEKFSSTSITCQEAGDSLVQGCTVTFKLPSESEVGSKLSVKNSALIYSICTSGQSCSINFGDVANEQVFVRNILVDQGKFNAEVNVPLEPGQFIKAEYQQAGLIGDAEIVNLGRYKLSYFPYFISRYDVFSLSTGRPITDTRDCAFEGRVDELNFAIEDVRGGGKLSAQLQKSEILNKNNLRDRGAVMTYISNFVAIVPQYQLFEGNTKYCYDKKIYAVEEVETTGGIYKIANTNTNAELETVECCNSGDVPSGYYCEDFEIKKLSESEGIQCNALNRCPIVGYQQLAGQQVASQECVDGECVTEYTDVECSYNTDCTNGYCDYDPNNPENSECVFIEPQDYCGNGVCEASRGETPQSCPADCSPTPPNNDNFLLYLFIGLGFIAVIVIMLIIRQRMGNKGQVSF